MTRVARWRWGVLAAVHVFFAAHWLHGRVYGATLAPLELSEAFRTLELGTVTLGFLVAAAAVGATFAFGRYFCGWGCHLLALQDLAQAGLARVGYTWRPPRWRVLRLMPWALLLWLVAGPLLSLVFSGAPGLHLDTSAVAGSFWTTEPWRNLPGPGVALLTLVVSAPVMVAVMGPRSFCRDVCPYGAVFGVAERLAPVRLVLGPGCTDCGACTSACRSGVDVLGWLRADGAVRDAACIRDLDCVAVCPTASIHVARAPIRAGAGPRRRDGAPLLEEALVGGLTVAAFLVYAGLYDTVPVLLAAALAVLTSTALAGAFVTPGRVRALVAVSVAGLLAHSAAIRVLEVGAARAYRAGDPAAVGQLEALARWGLVRPTSLHARLGSLYLADGRVDDARAELEAVLASNPNDPVIRRVLASLQER